jgi:hypothetical protein
MLDEVDIILDSELPIEKSHLTQFPHKFCLYCYLSRKMNISSSKVTSSRERGL